MEVFHKVETPETKKIDPVTKLAVIDKPASIDYQLVHTWPLPEGTEAIRKLYYYDGNGKVEQFLLNPGSRTHGPLQARVINLLSQVIGVRLGDQSHMINPSQDITLTATTTDGLFGFQYGLERKDAPPYVSPLKNLRFLNPQQRVTILVGYLPVIEYDSQDHARVTSYAPEAIRFFEDVATIPEPPKPAIVSQKITRR